jgi:hypothetical protein
MRKRCIEVIVMEHGNWASPMTQVTIPDDLSVPAVKMTLPVFA